MSGKYYPNNYDAIQEAPSEYFEECTVEDFFEWKVNGWMMPSSISCILRAQHINTGKVKEHVYKSPQRAVNRLVSYMESGQYEVTVCNHESISLVVNNDTNAD
tara:strand:- start:182 stop:490 length:309 start_codon:yes stop_codon:yes gene_type:complete